MAECCWYQTDVFTLWHYAKNTVAYYFKYRNKLTTEILEGGIGEPTPPTGVDVV
jgi:hypothetical protein